MQDLESISKIPLNHSYLSLYVEDDKGMVFNHVQQCLYQLPAISLALFIAIDEGLNEQQATEALSQLNSLDKNEIVRIYHEIQILFSKEKGEVTYLDGQYPELAKKAQTNLVENTEMSYVFQVANTLFSLDTNCDDLRREIIQLLAPCKTPNNNVDFVISIVKNDDSYTLEANGIIVETRLSYNETVPLFIDRLQILAFQNSDYKFCFHGAAIQTPKGQLLLPGLSGSGKSTLTAELIHYPQNSLYSDEIIALDNNFNLSVLNLPMAIKSGSWPILHEQYPTLEKATIWKRTDGRLLKYVWPRCFASTEISQNKFMIVNPNFIGGKSKTIKLPNIEVLSTIDTMAMLTQSGYQLGFELEEEHLENFIHFLCKNKGFKLQYENSQQALEQLDILWQKI